jgi:hypothetical protein
MPATGPDRARRVPAIRVELAGRNGLFFIAVSGGVFVVPLAVCSHEATRRRSRMIAANINNALFMVMAPSRR